MYGYLFKDRASLRSRAGSELITTFQSIKAYMRSNGVPSYGIQGAEKVRGVLMQVRK